MTHHLADKNVETRRAVCSVCGPVKIAKSGTGWACSTKTNANSRASKLGRPDRDRRGSNTHLLSWKDAETRTGVCVVDGAVEVVAWGRGWICSHRAEELGRVTKQEEPLKWCRDCWAECEGDHDRRKVWLRSDGVCPRCSTGQDLGAELRALEDQHRQMEDLEDGFHLVGEGDPYWMPEYESAVPGWRTIGATA